MIPRMSGLVDFEQSYNEKLVGAESCRAESCAPNRARRIAGYRWKQAPKKRSGGANKLNAADGELAPDGRLALQAEFVARKSGQQVRLADARVAKMKKKPNM
uniref:Uncharacterized protein n=1 Tax=Globodera rostochiensis TaxID=31243 RepID=A0A914H4T6_GLORO